MWKENLQALLDRRKELISLDEQRWKLVEDIDDYLDDNLGDLSSAWSEQKEDSWE